MYLKVMKAKLFYLKCFSFFLKLPLNLFYRISSICSIRERKMSNTNAKCAR